MRNQGLPAAIPLSVAMSDIEDGDLLLLRGRFSFAMGGRGRYRRAAKVVWWNEEPFCLEVDVRCGGRAVALRKLAHRYSGRVDVFEANPSNRWPEYNVGRAIRHMQKLISCPYGWRNVVRAGLAQLPVFGMPLRPGTDDASQPDYPPFNSEAIVLAEWLGGGVDPVPHLADRWTAPSDLSRSPFYRYRFTLKKDT